MVCCLVTAILLAVLHRLMPWRRANDDGGFAPVAVRLGPGMSGGATCATVSQRWLSPRDAACAWMLRFAGLTAAVYLAGSAVLVALHIADDLAPTWIWVLRSVIVAAVALVALSYASRLHRGAPDPSSRTQVIGFAMLASGAMAMVLMEVDMHLLGLYDIDDPGLHSALHSAAVLSTLAGAALALVVRGSDQPTRSMMGSAR